MESTKPIKILFFLVLIIVVGLIGYFIGTISSSNELNKYKEVLDTFYPELPDEIFLITGTIKAIDNSITIEIISLEERVLPGGEYKTEERKVSVNSETEIVKWNPFLIINENSSESDEIPISLSELEIEDRISVQANENIKVKKEFTAIKIILIEEL